MAFTGMVQGPGGTLRTMEILGPPTLAEWKESYDVLYTALIMLDAVRRPQLDAYRAKMQLYQAQYGERTWALQYQADVRCRQEQMPRLKHRLEAQHNADILAGRLSTYDTVRPWDSVWKAAIHCTDFWKAEYEVSAILIAASATRPHADLGGDADIAAGNRGQATNPVTAPPARSPNQPQPGARGGPPPQKPIAGKPQPNNGLTKRNVTNDTPPKQICRSYNTGICHSRTTQCQTGDRVHVCHYCLAPDHKGSDCTATALAASAGTWQPKARGGRGRGGGKKNKGGKKWQQR
jgi:hypothetical protein